MVITSNDPIVEYVDKIPSNVENIYKLELESNDPIQLLESLILEVEETLKEKAKQSEKTLIKVKIVESRQAEIATEVLEGKPAYLSLLFFFEDHSTSSYL